MKSNKDSDCIVKLQSIVPLCTWKTWQWSKGRDCALPTWGLRS